MWRSAPDGYRAGTLLIRSAESLWPTSQWHADGDAQGRIVVRMLRAAGGRMSALSNASMER